MKIHINGQPIMLDSLAIKNLSNALALFLTEDQQQRSFAVALNGDFVGRSHYHETVIKADDSIDVLFPIQGG